MVDPDTSSESLFVFPSESFEITFVLQTRNGDDPHEQLAALAELGTARAIQVGLPAPPSSSTTPSGGSAGQGLCAILSPEEASAALGGVAITSAMPGPDACGYTASNGAVTIQVWRDTKAAEMHQALATYPNSFEVAGMVAAQQDMSDPSNGTAATDLIALPNDSTAVEVFVMASGDVDVQANARALMEVIAPRLAPYVAP